MIIRTNDGKTVIGEFNTTDKVFLKKVRGSSHMLREPAGWAIDSDAVKILQMLDCREIQITDRENGNVYLVDMPTFNEKAIEIDRGFGKQLALPLQYWTLR